MAETKSRRRLDDLIGNRRMTPAQERRVWARALACRHFLVRAGLCTTEEFASVEAGILADIEQRISENIRKSVGADE